MVEDKYVFEDEDEEKETGFLAKLKDFGEFLWNSKTKEFCGRDGGSWAKVSLFYAVFYLCLSGFFIGMLAVLYSVLPKDKPTYHGYSSSMSVRGLNPGMGFRPQVDAEDWLIKYNPLIHTHDDFGFAKYVDNLKIFLNAKYDYKNRKALSACKSLNETSDEIANQGYSCEFDHEKLFEDTPCTLGNNFGYDTPSPCVLIKLNKIVSWKPLTDTGYITIKCAGENAFDVDNLKSVKYYSEDLKENENEARISVKYFPYMNQYNYRMPFIWAKLNVAPNVLVNVECKAYAANIDNSDRLNRRGQTKFSLFVQKKQLRND